MKYQKINRVVDANQWLPSQMRQPEPFEPDELGVFWYFSPDGKVSLGLIETTIDDFHHVDPKDWIVKDADGHVSVETPRSFSAKYEPLETVI